MNQTQDSGLVSLSYDPWSDSLYVGVRPGTAAKTVPHDDREFVIDYDDDGRVIGYDIQNASTHPDVVEEALRTVRQARGITV